MKVMFKYNHILKNYPPGNYVTSRPVAWRIYLEQFIRRLSQTYGNCWVYWEEKANGIIFEADSRVYDTKKRVLEYVEELKQRKRQDPIAFAQYFERCESVGEIIKT